MAKDTKPRTCSCLQPGQWYPQVVQGVHGTAIPASRAHSSRFSVFGNKGYNTHVDLAGDVHSFNWIEGDLQSPDKWSVFGQAVQTNNDVEGWHGMLKRHAKRGNLSFYLLVRLLHEQAQLVNMQVRLVTDQKLKRWQRKQYRQSQG